MNSPEDFKAAQAGDIDARNRLLVQNHGLRHKLARKLANSTTGWTADDLASEAVFPLLRAIQLFDPERGNQFSTYAYWAIYKHLVSYVAGKGKLVRIPQPSLVAIKQKTRRQQKATALTGSFGDDTHQFMLEAIPECRSDEADDLAQLRQSQELAEVALSVLPQYSERDQAVFRRRMIEGRTLIASGRLPKKIGPPISKERVRQIVAKILKRMKAEIDERESERTAGDRGRQGGGDGVCPMPERHPGDESHRTGHVPADCLDRCDTVGSERRAGGRCESAA